MLIGCHVPTTIPAEVARDAVLTFAREAEAREFASLWVSDHVVIPRDTAGYPAGGRFPIPPDVPYLEPVAMLGALAVVTQRARIGCSVFILGHRHAVAMAKMLATIDVLSGGRLICGVGVGWWRRELEILGVPFAARGRQGDEALRVFKTLWTEREPRFEGEFYRVADVGFMPKPLQRPHPPIWVGGNTPAALRRVVALGDGWHAMSKTPAELREQLAQLRALADAAGRAWETIEISLRFELSETVLGDGVQAVIDRLGEYEGAGVRHVAVVFRRDDPKRMLELLDLVAAKIRPALASR
ncbi:MAG TPA: LLM class F420-dependent oxidoreductase [Methylomirabilota bacterium]|jgi:probable F420-dependent oxidoreductase|nr:LLM class F420-dependent oxidoreductase [Methylomirabilota bacterium]